MENENVKSTMSSIKTTIENENLLNPLTQKICKRFRRKNNATEQQPKQQQQQQQKRNSRNTKQRKYHPLILMGDQNLNKRVASFIESPQPLPSLPSLKIYKNPSYEFLKKLNSETSGYHIESMYSADQMSDNEEAEEESKEERFILPEIVAGGIYKSKWADARQWYYTHDDEVCSYLRMPRKKSDLLSIHDVLKELKQKNVEKITTTDIETT